MRFQKSVKNLIASWLGQAFYIFVNLIIRKVFIYTLGEEYLGISGLFTNVLSILSLAELGIGTAINYSLYKPLAENCQEEIKAIMRFYKKVYRLIGCFILLIGFMIIPFLHYIVQGINQYEQIYCYYGIFVINTAVSYFFSYKATLIIANQERYIQIINHYIWVSLLGIIQVLVLLSTYNYILYLSMQTLFTFMENITISKIVDRKFSYLREKSNNQISLVTFNEIKKNTMAMLLNTIGTKLVTATDNIIVSKYIGLAIAGVYSNYAYIFSSVNMIFMQLFKAVQAGIGNLGIEGDIKNRRQVYKETYFIGFVVYSFGVICLASCVTPFVKIWIGENYILDSVTVNLVIGTFFLSGMRQANLAFINGLGLFWQIKWKALLEGGLNLILSVYMVKEIGLNGIFIGTIISAVVAGILIEPYTLFRYGLKDSYLNYMRINIKYFLFTGSIWILVAIVNNSVNINAGLIEVIIRFFIGFIIYGISFLCVWRKTTEFREVLRRVKNFLICIKGKK